MDVAEQSVVLRRRLVKKYRRKMLTRTRRIKFDPKLDELILMPRGPD